jgi:hypothetical protein
MTSSPGPAVNHTTSIKSGRKTHWGVILSAGNSKVKQFPTHQLGAVRGRVPLGTSGIRFEHNGSLGLTIKLLTAETHSYAYTLRACHKY